MSTSRSEIVDEDGEQIDPEETKLLMSLMQRLRHRWSGLGAHRCGMISWQNLQAARTFEGGVKNVLFSIISRLKYKKVMIFYRKAIDKYQPVVKPLSIMACSGFTEQSFEISSRPEITEERCPSALSHVRRSPQYCV